MIALQHHSSSVVEPGWGPPFSGLRTGRAGLSRCGCRGETTALGSSSERRAMRVDRRTVDLAEYPDLVVVYLGMRVRRVRGMLRLLGLGPKLYRSHRERPDGLLLHEDVVWALFPPHWGARQYWRDLDSLERWTRSDPHRQWWQRFLRDSGARGSGTRRTSCAAASTPCTTI
ncbi:monooxygenase family protein [Nocardia terpenica]|uniref:monooxygenase family protein n=2 Tax=Nocardia terpenica TaxID=455432 RepID=UPI00281689FA|nr:DUF4188 domain-containing protein [Nocardia terpenica]